MQVTIGNKIVGDGFPCYVVAEIGINHNGNCGIAKQLVSAAALSGCDAVKFQKRTVDVVYTAEELLKPRESPFGTTNGDLKRALELSEQDYTEISWRCREYDIDWFASCWDERSVSFVEKYNPPCYKIASASVTDADLLRCVCETGKPIIMSTGMTEPSDLDRAVDIVQTCGNDLILMHTVSTYPAKNDSLNLRCIEWLMERYGVLVGYSGHEIGLATTLAAVALGACVIERHITLDRSMYGSDQAASIEPHALMKLVRDIRAVEQALGTGEKTVLAEEVPIAAKLRRVHSL